MQTTDTVHTPESVFFKIYIYIYIFKAYQSLRNFATYHLQVHWGFLVAPQLGAAFANANLLKCFRNCYSLLLVLRAEVTVQQTRATTPPGCIPPPIAALWPSDKAFLFKNRMSEN